MEVISSSDARNNFAAILDKSQHEPVAIKKQGRKSNVIISYEEYERLVKAEVAAFQAICDEVGQKAERNGLTEEKLNKILSEDGN